MDMSKLTLDIFSQLEQKWLSDPVWSPPSKSRPMTRVLTIDGGFGPDGLVAAQALVHLESLIQLLTDNPSARITDHFDLVAGTGLGGVLALLLTVSTSRSPDSTGASSSPVFSASEARDFLFTNLSRLFSPVAGGRFFRRRRHRCSGKSFEKVLRECFRCLTLRDTCVPVLVPCYDLNSSAPFVFSRADASGSASFDFDLVEVCRATAGTLGVFKPRALTSVDGKTRCLGVDGGLVMNNPSAAAVTHVLHNKRDFPGVNGVEDLLVLSIGNGENGSGICDGRDFSKKAVMEIVLRGVSDTVDQILTNAFCWNPTDYVRIQANGLTTEQSTAVTAEGLGKAGERMLEEKSVESLPFGGKRLLSETNKKRMEAFVRRLVSPNSITSTVEPLLLLPPPSPSREEDDVGIPHLADGRCDLTAACRFCFI